MPRPSVIAAMCNIGPEVAKIFGEFEPADADDKPD